MENKTNHTFDYISIGEDNNDKTKQQYFLLNDDGTLISNISLQHVTEGQDGALSSIQHCTIYDATQHHYYVDTNGAELIPGELILQDESNNELFSNNYILQKDHETNIQVIDQMDFNVENPMAAEIHLFETNTSNDDTGSCKEENSEVTLTNEQCRLLEEKGRVILELDDKVYLLDPYGLRDITHDSELIESIRDDLFGNSSNDNETIVEDDFKIENATAPPDSEPLQQYHVTDVSTVLDPSKQPTDPKFEMIEDENNRDSKIIDSLETLKAREEKTENNFQSVQASNNIYPEFSLAPSLQLQQKFPKHKEKKIIRLNTNCHIKDIPQKVFIGYNANGKKLFAKVVDIKCSESKVQKFKVVRPDSSRKLKNADKIEAPTKPLLNQARTEQVTQENKIDKSKQLPQEIARQLDKGFWIASSDVADIRTAERTVSSLLKLPAVKSHLTEKYLLHTKTIHKSDASGKEVRLICEFVEGQVVRDDNTEEGWKFLWAPFSELVKNETAESANKNNKTSETNTEPQWMVHLHVTETLSDSQVSNINVTLYRRSFPLHRHKNRSSVRVCTECASIFKSETELKKHQKCHQVKSKEAKTGKTKQLGTIDLNELFCPYCKKSCNKFSNLVRHMETHIVKVQSKDKTKQPPETIRSFKSAATAHNVAKYKCKMCSSSYVHSSTLTRHIMKQHIDICKKYKLQ